ncbi:MAG TPA: hypothetical protein VF895_01165 [Gaiellaceae bacterium]
MRKRIRLGLLAVAGVGALAFAGVALAAYSPALTVSEGVTDTGSLTTEIAFSQSNSDDPTARLVILAPLGFTATLNQSPGTQIGTLDGSVFAGALGGAIVPVTGTVTVGDPTNATLMGAASQCTGVAAHQAIWLLNVTAAGQSLPAPVPLYVDPTTGTPFAAFASTSTVLCLPHPTLATFQIKLLSATLHIGGVYDNPATPGSYRWTAINTPWDPATPKINAAGTIETQSVERTPVETSFSGKLVTKTKRVKHGKHLDLLYSYSAKLSGKVTAGGDPAADANVDLFAGTKKIATLTTNSSGSFSKTVALKKTTSFHAAFSQESQTLAGASCQPAIPVAPGVDLPCGSITQAGFSETTDTKTVKKPKRTRKRIH